MIVEYLKYVASKSVVSSLILGGSFMIASETMAGELVPKKAATICITLPMINFVLSLRERIVADGIFSILAIYSYWAETPQSSAEIYVVVYCLIALYLFWIEALKVKIFVRYSYEINCCYAEGLLGGTRLLMPND